MADFAPNTLYYGDNLIVLRDFPSECVDLIYLDPPFNSNRSYNVLFKESKGTESEAQIEAFGDTWDWSQTTQDTYHSVVSRGDDVARLLEAMVSALQHNPVTAYLTMMTPRLIELRRVLKPTGSIYLHCDPTASHYLKVLMDAIFDPTNFKNEISWKRFSAKNDPKRFGRNHDVILFYSQSNTMTWNTQYGPFEEDYVDENYRYVEEGTGRRYRVGDLTANKGGGDVDYEWHGARPYKGRHWAYSRENMDRMLEEGRIIFRSTGMPVYKRYLDEQPGVPLQDIWTDLRLHSGSKERLGYPTQKPEALLERIIEASSNPGDIVLDPFCGCGTATVAAHRLGRQWIGIDITYLAVDLMRRRMLDTFQGQFPDGIDIDGEPADEASALALAERDPYQFQFWAVARLGGVARGGQNRKGADRGIDGVTTFPEFTESLEPKYRQVIVSVKGGNTGPAHVRELRGTVEREKAAIGVLVVIGEPTREMAREAAAAGLYEDPSDGKTYPHIQIITAEEIVHGKQIEMPSQRTASDFTRAPKARASRDQGRLEL